MTKADDFPGMPVKPGPTLIYISIILGKNYYFKKKLVKL